MTLNMDDISVAITDYILSGFTFYWFLSIRNLPSFDPRIKRYGLLFLIVSLSAFVGGTYHAIHPSLPPGVAAFLWKLLQILIAGAALVLLNILLGEFQSRLSVLARLIITTVVAITFSVVLFVFDNFLVCILSYLFFMLAMMGVSIYRYRVVKSQYYKYLIIGFAISLVAAGFQISGISLHKHFTHNDIYHMVQLLGLYFVLRAVKEVSKTIAL